MSKPKPYPREQIREATIAELPKVIEFFNEEAHKRHAKEHNSTVERMREIGCGDPIANSLSILLEAINADRATIKALKDELVARKATLIEVQRMLGGYWHHSTSSETLIEHIDAAMDLLTETQVHD